MIECLFIFFFVSRPSSQSLQTMIKEKNIAIIMSKLYVRSKKESKNVHGISRSMYSNNLEMIVEKGFPLLRKINDIISTMREMGLMNKFIEDFHYNTTILGKLRKTSKKFHREESSPDLTEIVIEYGDDDEGESLVVLTVEHLEGGFTLLLVGYVLSISVFAIELFAYSNIYKKCVRILKRIFNIQKNDSKKEEKRDQVQRRKRKPNKYKIERRRWKKPKKMNKVLW